MHECTFVPERTCDSNPNESKRLTSPYEIYGILFKYGILPQQEGMKLGIRGMERGRATIHRKRVIALQIGVKAEAKGLINIANKGTSRRGKACLFGSELMIVR